MSVNKHNRSTAASTLVEPNRERFLSQAVSEFAKTPLRALQRCSGSRPAGA